MDRNVGIKLVILAVVLAGPDTTRAAALARGTDSIDAAGAVRPLMSTSSSWMRLEDGVAPELSAVTALDLDVQREVLRGIDAGAGALGPDRQVCLKKKKCPAPGEPYTRPCAKIYHCRP
ncbi:hypothetical protein ZWY2020_026669 [Hordeum vulgare]|nr:hypothetical protein ZWY2020_026669 [Hordeum vulgare]